MSEHRGGRGRRSWTIGLACAALAAGPGRARRLSAAPPDPAAELDPRVAARLELWHGHARRTAENLVARYVATRTTSLASEPIVASGALTWRAPGELELRDDGFGGQRTEYRPGRLRVSLLRTDPPAPTVIDLERAPGVAWVFARLLAAFGPGDRAALLDHSEPRAPTGRTPSLELRPADGPAIRRQIRLLTLRLDPVSGAVIRVVIAEAQGDVLDLALSDHRQNVELAPAG